MHISKWILILYENNQLSDREMKILFHVINQNACRKDTITREDSANEWINRGFDWDDCAELLLDSGYYIDFDEAVDFFNDIYERHTNLSDLYNANI